MATPPFLAPSTPVPSRLVCVPTLGGCRLVSCIPMTWFPSSRKQYQRRHVSISTTNDEWYPCHTRDFCIHQLQSATCFTRRRNPYGLPTDGTDVKSTPVWYVGNPSQRRQLNSRLLFLNRKDDEATQVNTMMEERDCLQMDW